MNDSQIELHNKVLDFFTEFKRWPTNADLSKLLNVDRSTVSRRVERMVSNGDLEQIPKEFVRGKVRRVKAI